jgi:predicted metal-binding protein
LYNSSLCCPPHSPRPEETRRVLDCYRRAILVRCKPGVYVKELVAALEREVFLAGYYKALALGAGPCFLCEECSFDRCRHATEARPAMEACGIDVYATVRANGFPLEVVTDDKCDQNYYGVVLVD